MKIVDTKDYRGQIQSSLHSPGTKYYEGEFDIPLPEFAELSKSDKVRIAQAMFGDWGKDNEGQIIFYTGVHEDDCGCIIEYDPERTLPECPAAKQEMITIISSETIIKR